MTNNKNINSVKFFEDFFATPKLLTIDSSSELLSLANKFKKIEHYYYEKNQDVLIKKKIAILGSFTTNYITYILLRVPDELLVA